MSRTRILVGLLAINLIFCFIILANIGGTTNKLQDVRFSTKTHELCVIVPYRNRYEELQEFAPYISKYLTAQNVRHNILIMNQTDEFRFNRASLINVGWRESARLGCTYIVMHDVDLLPQNPKIDYGYPGDGIVRHISSPQYHPKYNYTKFIGGILMLTMTDYAKIDGMSNKYWGWGLEDDEFYLRIKESDLNVTRTANLTTDKSNTFKHIHPAKRKRDYAVVTKDQKEMKRKRDRISGLHNVKYNISGRETLQFGGDVFVRAINVKLECDLKWTSYCIQPKKTERRMHV